MLIQSLANAAKIVTEARKYTLLLETQERNLLIPHTETKTLEWKSKVLKNHLQDSKVNPTLADLDADDPLCRKFILRNIDVFRYPNWQYICLMCHKNARNYLIAEHQNKIFIDADQ